jgi:hypothetical protein
MPGKYCDTDEVGLPPVYDCMISGDYQKYEGSSRSLQRGRQTKANLYSRQLSRTQAGQRALLNVRKFEFWLTMTQNAYLLTFHCL